MKKYGIENALKYSSIWENLEAKQVGSTFEMSWLREKKFWMEKNLLILTFLDSFLNHIFAVH